ncbi:hypothetical protein BDQ17DRAFT_1045478 [Cyathus striatus]|nr:hypothetical protein BDQ17DRAFT_1045478 [Cyathus striatus]
MHYHPCSERYKSPLDRDRVLRGAGLPLLRIGAGLFFHPPFSLITKQSSPGILHPGMRVSLTVVTALCIGSSLGLVIVGELSSKGLAAQRFGLPQSPYPSQKAHKLASPTSVTTLTLYRAAHRLKTTNILSIGLLEAGLKSFRDLFRLATTERVRF